GGGGGTPGMSFATSRGGSAGETFVATSRGGSRCACSLCGRERWLFCTSRGAAPARGPFAGGLGVAAAVVTRDAGSTAARDDGLGAGNGGVGAADCGAAEATGFAGAAPATEDPAFADEDGWPAATVVVASLGVERSKP